MFIKESLKQYTIMFFYWLQLVLRPESWTLPPWGEGKCCFFQGNNILENTLHSRSQNHFDQLCILVCHTVKCSNNIGQLIKKMDFMSVAAAGFKCKEKHQKSHATGSQPSMDTCMLKLYMFWFLEELFLCKW